MTTALRGNPEIDALARAMGRLIRAERKRLNLSQEDLAERLGVSQNAVTGWEVGEKHAALHLAVVLGLAEAFGLSPGVILQRLGLVASTADFEAATLWDPALKPDQKETLINVRRAMVDTNT